MTELKWRIIKSIPAKENGEEEEDEQDEEEEEEEAEKKEKEREKKKVLEEIVKSAMPKTGAKFVA